MMSNIPIINQIDAKKEEIEMISYNYVIEKRALEHRYDRELERLDEKTKEQKRTIQTEIEQLSETIELMSLYNAEALARIIAKLLNVYEGIEYQYYKDMKKNFIIRDNSIDSTQEEQLYAYHLQRDLDKLRYVSPDQRRKTLAFLPPREYYTNVLYGYDRKISKVQKTVEDFIEYLFNIRINNNITDITSKELDDILMSYISREDVIDEYLERSGERAEELKVFAEIHERSQNKNGIELPTSYTFKALRELIKRGEADRFEVEHQYIKEDDDITFEMIVRTHQELLPYLNDCIQISIGDKKDGNYPKTISYKTVEEHISLLYKYIPRVKKFMENLYSIAILKKKDGIIILEESDIKQAYELTIKQKVYALTKVKKTKKGV